MFQVGANVTAENQIHVSIDDVRITSGTDTTYTALANIDVTDTTQNAISASLVDSAIASVSALRGKLGADQNRFQSTIANLQVTTENLSASESRIRDTDMACRNGQLHPGPDPAAGGYGHARPGELGPADRPEAPPVDLSLGTFLVTTSSP